MVVGALRSSGRSVHEQIVTRGAHSEQPLWPTGHPGKRRRQLESALARGWVLERKTPECPVIQHGARRTSARAGWQANLRVLDVDEIKTAPDIPWSHPCGRVRSELGVSGRGAGLGLVRGQFQDSEEASLPHV